MNDSYQISIPKLSGYKTITVNAALIAFGIANVIWPKVHLPDGQTLGLLFDQTSAAVVSVTGLINIVLRLITTTPAFTAPGGSSSGGGDGEKYTSAQRVEMGLSDPPLQLLHSDIVYIPGQPIEIMHARGHDWSVGEALTFDREVNGEPGHWACDEQFPAFLYRSGTVSHRETRVQSSWVMGLLVCIAVGMSVLVPGCAAVQNVITVADEQSAETTAFAAYGAYVATQEQALATVTNKSLTIASRREVQRVSALAKLPADALRLAARDAVQARMAYQAGSASVDVLSAATARLSAATASAQAASAQLTAAIEGAK